MSQIFSRTRVAMGVLFSGVILSANVACAQAAKQLVGTWRLISATTEQGDKTTPTYGLKGTSKNTISPCVKATIAYNLNS